MTSEPLSEFDLIQELFVPLTNGFAGALGLRDDAALLDVPDARQLVVTSDCLIADVHFFSTDPPESIAAKALSVNVSDLASMAATPLGYTLTIAIPKGTAIDWLRSFATQLGKTQDAYDITLIGGDTVSTPGPLTLTITAFGHVEQGRALQRSTAQPGDDIYVSGTIGDAALALHCQQNPDFNVNSKTKDDLIGRYRFPTARINLGQELSSLATACADISDGLIKDLGNICKTSAINAEISIDAIPLSHGANEIISKHPELMDAILCGGDDYELIFTASPLNRDKILSLNKPDSVAISRIGFAKDTFHPKSDQITVIKPDGSAYPLQPNLGFIHRW